MQKSLILGVSIGESFAEYSLVSDLKPLAKRRVSLSRSGLKSSLQAFLAENKELQPHLAFISLRVPRRLLDFQMSGAAAHIATEGFQNWLSLGRGPARELTRKDLHFSIAERTLADGTVETPPDLEKLSEIAEKIIKKDCKKVCLHFLHASANSENIVKAKGLLEEKGLQVFIPDNAADVSEIPRWNKNALSATTSGVFSALGEEIKTALQDCINENNIHFINSSGKVFKKRPHQSIESLFSLSTSIGKTLGKSGDCDVLFLGLESFQLISNKNMHPTWQSPWGPVDLLHLQAKELRTQPTSGISINENGHFDFSPETEGWEPGPMIWGRGQKPSLIDLWGEDEALGKVQGLEDRASATGVQRFKNALIAMGKISRTRENDIQILIQKMQHHAKEKLLIESILHRESKKIFVTGPLAHLFTDVFQKDSDAIIDKDPICEGFAVATCGLEALGENI